MGITDDFYQLMINTEPSKMLIYTGSDYEKLVPKLDPTYEEIQVALEARRYGVTTSEMRARKAEAERCPHQPGKDGSISFDCDDAIKWGLSLDVYQRRMKETKNVGSARNNTGVTRNVTRITKLRKNREMTYLLFSNAKLAFGTSC